VNDFNIEIAKELAKELIKFLKYNFFLILILSEELFQINIAFINV
jgi:hypothetical protein